MFIRCTFKLYHVRVDVHLIKKYRYEEYVDIFDEKNSFISRYDTHNYRVKYLICSTSSCIKISYLFIANQVAGRLELRNSKICPQQGMQGKRSYTAPYRICETEISMALTLIGSILRVETTKRTSFSY